MIVPEFLHYYGGYTTDTLLGEYAQRFFALVNAMYRMHAQDMINGINQVAIGNSDNRQDIIDKLDKSAQGLHGIVQEVRSIKQ